MSASYHQNPLVSLSLKLGVLVLSAPTVVGICVYVYLHIDFYFILKKLDFIIFVWVETG